jgi:hypothetical protein
MMISVTIDIEWAPDPVLADTLELLDEYDVAATLFSTHDDPFDVSGHERAIHPNFEGDLNSEATIDELLELYPDTIGIRSHRLAISSPLRAKLGEKGMKYESNYMMYRVSDLSPFQMPAGITQFPIYWMDDVWFHNRTNNPDVDTLVSVDGLTVFDFHPPHIYYNTPSPEYYKKHKDTFWESPNENLRYQGTGVRDVFVALLDHVSRNGLATATLSELYEKDAP